MGAAPRDHFSDAGSSTQHPHGDSVEPGWQWGSAEPAGIWKVEGAKEKELQVSS